MAASFDTDIKIMTDDTHFLSINPDVAQHMNLFKEMARVRTPGVPCVYRFPHLNMQALTYVLNWIVYHINDPKVKGFSYGDALPNWDRAYLRAIPANLVYTVAATADFFGVDGLIDAFAMFSLEQMQMVLANDMGVDFASLPNAEAPNAPQ